ncbi:MAG: OmpA family protein [Sneathiella sp.]|nr:OmpA family protein [Sneathiella sp.]
MVSLQISTLLDLKGMKSGVSKTALMAAILAISACSTPDWADPTEWFDGDSSGPARPTQIEQPKDEYPALGSVPDEAGKNVSIEEARDIAEGLKADRENAQYTDEKLRADTAPQAMPMPKAAPVVPQTAAVPVSNGPTVPAIPTATVAAAPIPSPVQIPSVGMPKPVAVPPIGQASTMGQVPQVSQTSSGVKLMPNAAPVTTPQQAYSRIAPGTGTTVISGTGVNNVFQQQLAASAATTTNLPANMQFQSYPAQPLGPSAVTVSPIVRDTYNNPIIAGYGANVGGATAQGRAYGVPMTSGAQPDAIIYFETGSSRIGAGDRAKLAKLVQVQKQTGALIRVVGHASSRTRELPEDRHMLVNLRMSQQRTSAVVASLIKMGADTSKVILESVSDRAPITREAMPSAEAKNRRTEIFLVK